MTLSWNLFFSFLIC